MLLLERMLSIMKCPDKEYFLLKVMSDLHVSAWLPNLELLSYNSCWSLKQILQLYSNKSVCAVLVFLDLLSFTCHSSPEWTGRLHFQVYSAITYFSSEPDLKISTSGRTLGLTSCHLECYWQFINLCSHFYVNLFPLYVRFCYFHSLLIEILEGRSWAVFFLSSLSPIAS